MGQIVSSAAKPKRCNINQLSQLGTPAAGEHILVSSDNSMNAAGQGNFDSYIVGDGTTAATALPLHTIANNSVEKNSKNGVTSGAVYDAIDWGKKEPVYTESTTASVIANVELANTMLKSVDFSEVPTTYEKGRLRVKQIYLMGTYDTGTRWVNQFSIVDANNVILKTYTFNFYALYADAGKTTTITVDGLTTVWDTDVLLSYAEQAASTIINGGGVLIDYYRINLLSEEKYLSGKVLEQNSVPTSAIDGLSSAVESELANSESIIIGIVQDNSRIVAESVLDEIGGNETIIGLNGSDSGILATLNNAIKYIETNGSIAHPKESARLRQLYCLNPSTHSWQIQVGFVVEGQTLLQDTVSISFYNEVETNSNGNIVASVDKTFLSELEEGHDSAFEYFYAPLATNPYQVHFANDDIYISGQKIGDGTINENKLSNDVRLKLNAQKSFLTDKTLITLCDSLGTSGVWQEKLKELTGCIFDASKNSANYSWGGTKTLTIYDQCGQGRAKKLVEDVSNGITPTPDVIIIENVNDGNANAGTLTDGSFFRTNVAYLDNTHKQPSESAAAAYWNSDFANIVGGINAQVGTIIAIPYNTETGIKLTITSNATSSGNFGILLSGMGESVKYIAVESGDTIAEIIAKINEYDFNNWSKVLDGNDSIIFSYKDGSQGTLTIFQGTTGITYTQESGIEGTLFYPMFFDSHDVAKWTDSSYWKNSISLYKAWKGMVEYLQGNFPNAYIFWFIPKTYQVNYSANSYKKEDGSIDWDAINAADYSPTLFSQQIAMAEYMGIPVLDIRQEACINAGNISTFCNDGNVHPKEAGYERWGEVLAKMLS